MKKHAYILGSIEVMIGALLLCATSIITEVLPVLGYVAFQAAAAGSYSAGDYSVSFPLVTGVSIFLIILGIVQIVLFSILHTKE